MNTVRTVSDAKRDFFQAFPQPITAVYRRVIDELLVELHLLTVNQTFHYDSIFALGTVTVFDQFMDGYVPQTDLDRIREALFSAVQLSPNQLHQDAQRLQELATTAKEGVADLLTNLETNIDLAPLSTQLREISASPRFKYSRLFAVGLSTLTAAITETPDRQTELLKQCCVALNPGWDQANGVPSDRFLRDLDLYRSNLEKMQQAKQMMVDLVEAERKKRENKAKEQSQNSSSQGVA